MTPDRFADERSSSSRWRASRSAAGCVGLLIAASFVAVAQTSPAGTATGGAASAARVAVKGGPAWAALSPAERTNLQPLQRDWAYIDESQKRKWLEMAVRMPAMRPDERVRIQERMTEWARLSPQERGRVRLGFQEATLAAPQDRKAQWEAYQALPPERKQELAARAAPPASVARAARGDRGDRGDRESPQTKSNIVAAPAAAVQPKTVAPTVVQAQPGATTTLISKRPTPPAHQQTGLPKIAATPGFVDKSTLLPQRGPQGAATRSAAASAPLPRP